MRPLRKLSGFVLLAAAVTAAAAEEVRLEVSATKGEIVVDGVLGDAEWADALAIPIDVEYLPGDNITPPVKTVGYLTFSESHLYVAWRCLDPEPDKIRAHLMNRDDVSTLSQDDHVMLIVDAFNDQRRAIQLRVNPFGVQADALFGEPSIEDFSYDLIWKSAARIDSNGWTAEIAVPFSQLRFPPGSDVQTWGVDLQRSYPRNVRHRISSQRRDRNRACILCQTTKVAGFQGLRAGRNLEIAPTLTGIRSDRRGVFGQTEGTEDDVDAGLSLRWSPTPNWTLNGAVNPDFSQVEADVAQLGVNQRFALFFQEQRPFFLEGSDLFSTPIRAVFTRTVADPDWGIKLTGKSGAGAFGAFAARDAINSFLLPSNQFSRSAFLDEEVDSGVLRYRRDVGTSSSLGVLWTGREGEVYSNHVAGVDAFLLLDSKHSVRAQYLRSRTRYPGSVSQDFDQPLGAFEDDAVQLSYNYDSREWNNWFWFQDRGEGFRADSGFEPRADLRSVNTGVQRTFWGDPGDALRQVATWGRYRRIETQRGELSEEAFEGQLFLRGPLQSVGFLELRQRRERFLDVLHEDLFAADVFGSFQPSGDLDLGLFASIQDEIDLVNNRVGDQWTAKVFATWKPGRRWTLRLDHTSRALQLESRADGGDVVAGGDIFDVQLTQLRAVYNLNVRSFLRVILQYQNLEREEHLYPFPVEPTEETLLSQLLYSYTVNPQTVVFAGYSENRLGIQGLTLKETDRTFFVKLGYAWLP